MRQYLKDFELDHYDHKDQSLGSNFPLPIDSHRCNDRLRITGLNWITWIILT